MKMKELESLLREARQVLNDWCEEYGHGELKLMRNKIDEYFAECHLGISAYDVGTGGIKLYDGENSRACNCFFHKAGELTGGWFCPVHGHRF